jgi:hypothetical protein
MFTVQGLKIFRFFLLILQNLQNYENRKTPHYSPEVLKDLSGASLK